MQMDKVCLLLVLLVAVRGTATKHNVLLSTSNGGRFRVIVVAGVCHPGWTAQKSGTWCVWVGLCPGCPMP